MGRHLKDQTVIGRYHRNAADTEISGKDVIGGQAGSGRKTAGKNIATQGITELFIAGGRHRRKGYR